ncbi:MAG TPA: hypothetical protein VK886_08115 [Vicinamibacterales bacterium]|nr:hypothetical protein [Vicinamibacterales bacterium]
MDLLDRVVIAVRRELFPAPQRPWVFYLINDRDTPIDNARLEEVGYEWGDYSSERRVEREIGHLGPRSYRRIWRDNSDAAEVNTWIVLSLVIGGATHWLMYEFPKLYRRRGLVAIPLVGGRGVVCRGETCAAR